MTTWLILRILKRLAKHDLLIQSVEMLPGFQTRFAFETED